MTLTGLPVAAAASRQVGLAAEKGRDLQNVHGLGDGCALLGLVHVGDDRQAETLSDLGEDRQRLGESRCPARFAALVRFALSKELL